MKRWLMSNWSELLILGDSIALGAAEVRGSDVLEYVSPSCVDLLKSALPRLTVRVDALVSRNSATVRQEIEQIIARHAPLKGIGILLIIGGSDADMDWKRFVLSDGAIARSRVPVERYEANLRLICSRLMQAGATPILTDVPNHHFVLRGPYISRLAGKDIVPLLESGGGQAESDRHLQMYRAAAARIAGDLKLELISYGPLLDAHSPLEVTCQDGAHPNAAGHRIIASALIAGLTGRLAADAVELSA
jgi:lysophospholipase L1-like esterase